MRNIKMICVDLDGTLLTNKKEVTPFTRETLVKANEKGAILVIATGRPYSGVPQELLTLPGLQYVIASNGGRAVDMKTKSLICSFPLPHEKACEVLRILENYHTLKEIYFDGNGFVQQKELEEIIKFQSNPAMRDYILKSRAPIDSIWDKMEEMKGQGLDKVHALFETLEERDEAWKEMQEIAGISLCSSMEKNMEINAEGVNKGHTILKLGEIVGIARDEIAAFGDSNNDIDMIRMVGNGVAMENATAEVKAAANEITESNEKDGVAKMLVKYFDL